MKRLLTAILATGGIMLASAAHAQLWDGPEIGVQGGYGWGTSAGTVTPLGGPVYSFHSTNSGGLGGVHLGYDTQYGSYVFGLEGDVEGGQISGQGGLTAGVGAVSTKVDIAGSLRGKLGFAVNRLLFYGTGGVAFGRVNSVIQSPVGFDVATPGEFRVGWTAGAGIAYALTNHWVIGAEYRYTDLGSHGVINTNQQFTYDSSVNYSLVLLSLSFRFTGPTPPPMVEAAPPPVPVPVAAVEAAPPPPPRAFLVFFDFDRYDLSPDARRVIEAAATAYRTKGAARVEVAGYTDLAGTQAYNLRLSQRRADTVAAYLRNWACRPTRWT